MPRVFVVSAGSITAAGNLLTTQWKTLSSGMSKFHMLSEAVQWLPDVFGEIKNDALVAPVPHTDAELAELAGVKARGYDRHQLLAFIAAKEAMAGMEEMEFDNFACIGATGGAGLLSIYESSMKLAAGKRLGPRDNLQYLPNLFVGYLTQQYRLSGPSEVHGTACAASMHAMMSLARMIQTGEVAGGLVVGAEAAISPFGIASFQGQRALGNGLAYQAERSGFMMGEGAAALLLMSEEAVETYNVIPLVELAGWCATSDASSEGAVTDPNPEGAARAMRGALKMANISLSDVGLVKTHGTATPKGDLSELKALQLVDAEVAAATSVMSLKSYIGHLLGAAGIAEIALAIRMMHNGVIFPTHGLTPEKLDPECNIVTHPFEPTQAYLNHVLANGFGFGGTNASLVLKLCS